MTKNLSGATLPGSLHDNKFSRLVHDQKVTIVPEFELESAHVLTDVPVAYKTWGKLNKKGNNCMVVCHALTGSSDISDWWGPLLGVDKAFDPSKFFIICLNSLGSPYGTASPVTIDPTTGKKYGPEFPLTTVRDDVLLHRIVLDSLGVKQVAVVIGGSMGGMLALEYPIIFGPLYVRSVIALATSARHSAWCISWGEAQRQSIYCDPKYFDGYYEEEDGPTVGLAAARMSALLTYRSRNSFESRFGRKDPHKSPHLSRGKVQLDTNEDPATPREEHWSIHNEGHVKRKLASLSSLTSLASEASTSPLLTKNHQTFFTAQSYLRYQGQKFVGRYDPNCYIAISRKLDTHDLARDRYKVVDGKKVPLKLEEALSKITQPTLIMGVPSDGLFTYGEQELLAQCIPDSHLYQIDSPEGHDAFLLEFQEINDVIRQFETLHLKDILDQDPVEVTGLNQNAGDSLFGEAEEITNW